MTLNAERWHGLVAQFPAADKAMEWFDDVVSRYGESHRHYHNTQHISECLNEFDSAKRLAVDAVAVEFAIWLHDVIYDPKRSDNEEQSAGFAREVLEDVEADREIIRKVRDFILVTKHNALPKKVDEKLLSDIDLSILGKGEQRFWEYERQVREEYSFVPEEIFRTKRAEILEIFLTRPKLFQTELFQERYEAQARGNLAKSIRRLRGGS